MSDVAVAAGKNCFWLGLCTVSTRTRRHKQTNNVDGYVQGVAWGGLEFILYTGFEIASASSSSAGQLATR
jgi:hypothetical protein